MYISGLYVSGVEFADEILVKLQEWGPLLLKLLPSLIIGAVSNYYITRQQRKKWEDQEFLKAVQISLNYIDIVPGKGPTLQFRTLDECQVDDLMNGNSEGISKILAACDSTTVDQSFLGVVAKGQPQQVQFKHLDMFMKAVVNRISVKFSEGYLDYDFRIPVLQKEYWLGLTCEKPKKGQTFARKIRVMVASDGFLRSIPKYLDPPKFEIPHHVARWECLQQMYKIYISDKNQVGKAGKFWEKQILRKVKIFRPLHYPFDRVDGDQVVRKDMTTRRSPGDRFLTSRIDDRVVQEKAVGRERKNSAKKMLKTASSLGQTSY